MITSVGSPTSVLLNRNLISEFIKMKPVPGERRLSEQRITRHQKSLFDDCFHSPRWTRAFCKETGLFHRVNGNHTSVLFSRLDDPLPAINVIVEEYHCDTLMDLSALYAGYDSTVCSKTSGDVIRSYMQSTPKLMNFSFDRVMACVNGICYAKNIEGYESITAQVKAEDMLNHLDFVVWYHSLVGTKAEHKRKLLRCPVAAVMFKTWERSQAGAENFWVLVRDERGPSPDSPDRKLARFLLRYSIIGGKYRRGDQDTEDARIFFNKSIKAWNAWRGTEELDNGYVPRHIIPDVK